MIFDSLENISRYKGIAGKLPFALEFLAKTDLHSLNPGRIEVDGDVLFALVQEYETKPLEKGLWEAHRKYIDVQYMVTGIERMGYGKLGLMKPGEYTAEKDFQAVEGTGNFVDVFPGYFAIFYPDDAHMAGLISGETGKIKKVVMKVKI